MILNLRFLSVAMMIGVLWLSACGNQQMAVIGATPIPIPSVAEVATPLLPEVTSVSERKWMAPPVLVEIYTMPGMATEAQAWGQTSNLVIYRNGLVVREWTQTIEDRNERHYWLGQLKKEEICTLLLKIETDGFFDNDLADSVPSVVSDESTVHIAVNGWRTQSISVKGLGRVVVPEASEVVIPSGIANTFEWLEEFSPKPFDRLYPEFVQIRIEHLGTNAPDSIPLWGHSYYQLEKWVLEHGQVNQEGISVAALTLEEDAAQYVWVRMQGQITRHFKDQDNNLYSVTIRPVLPFENRPAEGEALANPPRYVGELQEMDCTDVDSLDFEATQAEFVIPTPTPTFHLTSPVERSWEAPPVLVHLYNTPGYTDVPFGWAMSSELVVYVDGMVIVSHYRLTDEWHIQREFYQAQLTHTELCGLFLTMEYNGLFDANEDFEGPILMDHGDTILNVRGWRNHYLRRVGLDTLTMNTLNGDTRYLSVGVAQTLDWLWNFKASNETLYTPEQVQMWIWEMRDRGMGGLDEEKTPVPWGVSNLSLATLMESATVDEWERETVLLEFNSADAEAIWAFAGNDMWGIYEEGDAQYMVAVRPLLPFEVRTLNDDIWGSGASEPEFPTEPRQEIDCTDATIQPLDMDLYRQK